MDSITTALGALDATIAKHKPKDRKRLAEIAGHASSHLVLLKLQYISTQITQKLVVFLRESLPVLYASVGLAALRLASAILQSIYHERLLPAIGNMQPDQQNLWESVLHALLAGLLDYLDTHDTKEVKGLIGVALYSSLCEVCSSLSAPKTSVDLRCTAYNILSDSAASHPENQEKLRDKDILGGERLGSCLWRTKDYLAIEGLLNLFARTIPSTHNTPSGRSKRSAYIHSVFVSCAPPEAASTGSDICELLENVPTSNWDDTAMKIVDALAKGNITYPQPFAVTGVTACGNNYRSDRLYADNKTLLVNVLLDDDQYESLEIPYSTIQDVDFKQSAQDNTQVTVSVREPPRLGKSHVREGKTTGMVLFTIPSKHVGGLVEVFRSRGLSHAGVEIADTFRSPHMPKLSIAAKPANLELDSAGRFVEELSQTERIENVSQFYQTNEPSDPILSPGDSEQFQAVVDASPSPQKALPSSPSLLPAPKPSPSPAASPQTNLRPLTGDTTKDLEAGCGTSLTRADSHLIRAAVFGLSDEELSEISDYDSPLPRSKVLRRSSTATLVRGRISFQPLNATSTTGASSSSTRVARGGVGKVILDSDDDSPPAAPASAASRLAKKKIALARDPTVDDSQSAAAMPAFVRPDALVPASPVTPSPLLGDVTLVSSNGPKVLRFSDIPAPNFNAPSSSPAVAPKSALKSALAKKLAPSRLSKSIALEPALSDAESAPVPTASAKDLTASAIKASDILNDLAPPSSSPTPGVKKTVKAKLRKKEDHHPQSNKTSDTASAKKRKSSAPDDDNDDPEPLTALNNGTSRAAKRARTVALPPASPSPLASPIDGAAEAPKGILNQRSDSQILRPRATAAARATKKYHAKKGRTSSPIPPDGPPQAKTSSVDYDALPSPPRPSVPIARPPSPAPKGKRAAKPKPRAPAKAEAVAKPGPEKDRNAREITDDAPKKPASAAPARKVRPRPVKKVAQDKGETRAEEVVSTTAPAVDRAPVAPEVTEPRRPRRAQRKDAPEESAAEITNENNTDLEEVPPIDEYLGGALFDANSADFANIASTPQADSDARDTSDAALSNPALVARVEVRKIIERVPVTSSKKSSTTPWDAAFGDASEIVPRVEKVPPQATGTAADIGSDDRMMDVDDDGISSLQHPIAESVVAPEPVVGDILRPTVHAAETSLADLRCEKTAPTISKADRQTAAIPDNRRTIASATKSAPIPLSAVMKEEPETIDLTLDSPPRYTKRALAVQDRTEPSPSRPPTISATTKLHEPKHVVANLDDDDDHNILEYEEKGRKARIYQDELSSLRPRIHTPEPEGDSLLIVDRRGRQGKPSNEACQRNEPVLPTKAPRERGVAGLRQEKNDIKNRLGVDRGSDRLVDVIGQLHDTILYNMENKFEGVRHHARLGRNELVRCAVADLGSMRAESVAQFNKLVDLEAEYATVGRGLIRGSEDWMKTNRELSQNLTDVLERHDRAMLSKKMPPSLIASVL